MENKKLIIAASVGGGIFLILLIIIVILAMSGSAKVPEVAASDVLVDRALSADTVQAKEAAALDLARSEAPDALENLRRLLDQSKDFEVLVATIDGIGAREDRVSLPKFIVIVKNETVFDDPMKANRMRGRAARAIATITGADFGWDPEQIQDDAQLEKLDKTLENAQLFATNMPIGEKLRPGKVYGEKKGKSK